MKIGRRFRGSPIWEDVQRVRNSDIGVTHRQNVSFTYANKCYTATFVRYFNPRLPQGERVSYSLDIQNNGTGRYSEAFSKAMLEQTQWLSTFKMNVQEWADNFGKEA